MTKPGTETPAADARLVLSVQIPTAEKRAKAADGLHQAGAREITIL